MFLLDHNPLLTYTPERCNHDLSLMPYERYNTIGVGL